VMRSVLHLTRGLGPLHGGPGASLDDYCRAIARRGWRVVLATTCQSCADDPERVLPKFEGDRRLAYTRLAFPVARHLPTVASERWRFSPPLLRWLLANLRAFDLIHVHSFYLFPTIAGAKLASLYKIPYVITTHGVFDSVQRPVRRRRKLIHDALIGGAILKRAAAIIYSSVREYEDATAAGIRCPAAIIANGINTHEFKQLPPNGTFRQRFLAGRAGPIVLYLGRLNEKKGLDVLIAAFARIARRFTDALLVVVGEGDPKGYEQVIARQATERGLDDRVIMTGLLMGSEKLAVLRDAELFVLPSRGENFGTAMFEAMACGLPVVVSHGVDLGREVARAGAGLAVELDDARLADAIAELLGSPARRHRMGAKGRMLAEEYGWDKTAVHIDELYRHVRCNDLPCLWAWPYSDTSPSGTVRNAASGQWCFGPQAWQPP
jgi:glycosyltransferase involved in cell wall biosynthesis